MRFNTFEAANNKGKKEQSKCDRSKKKNLPNIGSFGRCSWKS